jgi:hypothetical protein
MDEHSMLPLVLLVGVRTTVPKWESVMQENTASARHVYEVVKVVEFTAEMEESSCVVRVELLQSRNDAGQFKARLWRNDFYHLQSKFPTDPDTHQPLHGPSD